MYNMAAMHKEDNKTEFQLKPTNQQRRRRLCDKSRRDNLVSSATPSQGALTVWRQYITAVQRLLLLFLRKLILAVIIPVVIKS